MPSVALTLPISGQIITAALHTNNYSALQAAVNGLDNNNIAAAAGISLSKLGQSGATAGQVPVWNGSSWVPGSVKATSTWAGGPPGSPADGDIWIATAVDANGTRWQFQYNAGSGSTYKWEFIGGPPVVQEVSTSETTSSTTYAALTTAGPAVALGRAGDYIVEVGAVINNGTTGADNYISYDIGGTGAVDADGARSQNSGVAANTFTEAQRFRVKLAIAAATTLTAKYRVSAGTGAFSNRRMRVTPVRII